MRSEFDGLIWLVEGSVAKLNRLCAALHNFQRLSIWKRLQILSTGLSFWDRR